MRPLVSNPVKGLSGTTPPPGDKSISHRALMLGALAIGESTVTGLLEGADVLATADVLRTLGADIEKTGDSAWRVTGRGVGGLSEPRSVLDFGNSGTGARLMMGILATHPFRSVLTGDESLCHRPMGRVAEPLRLMGASIDAKPGDRLPLTIDGAADDGLPVPITWPMTVASAQVKSAILLAGLNTPGRTAVIEPQPTRDHTERLLRYFGATVEIDDAAEGGHEIAVTGYPELVARDVAVPADPSSAAFPLTAALLVPGSDVRLPGIGVNPRRTGLFDTLREMGATLTLTNERDIGGEPVADVAVRAGPLEGVSVPAERAPSMIDEYPILAVAAAVAKGETVLSGLAELRVKESDRLSAIADGLRLCGVKADVRGDDLVIEGCGGPPPGPADGTLVQTFMDHRIAMSFLVLGMAAQTPVRVDDGAMIETSFPGFRAFMNDLGADIAE